MLDRCPEGRRGGAPATYSLWLPRGARPGLRPLVVFEATAAGEKEEPQRSGPSQQKSASHSPFTSRAILASALHRKRPCGMPESLESPPHAHQKGLKERSGGRRRELRSVKVVWFPPFH